MSAVVLVVLCAVVAVGQGVGLVLLYRLTVAVSGVRQNVYIQRDPIPAVGDDEGLVARETVLPDPEVAKTKRISIVDVVDALRGTPDYPKVVGVSPAALTHWELSELVGRGISLDGVFRVLRQAKVKRRPTLEEEPRPTSRMGLKQAHDLRNVMPALVDLPCCAVHCQCDHGSTSSLGGVVGTSEPNGEVR